MVVSTEDAKKKILIADDEVSIVQLCQLVLEGAGFKVAVAYNGHQALRIFAEEQPDLVLLDMMMPGMDGLEACRQIRARPDNYQPRIIIYTADDADSARKKSLAAGADAIITKRTSVYELAGKIKSCLNITS